jgi:hypothetical protein
MDISTKAAKDIAEYLSCAARTLPDTVSKETCKKLDDAAQLFEALAADRDALQAEINRLRLAGMAAKKTAEAILDRAKSDFAGVAYENDARAIIAAMKGHIDE